MNLGKLSDPLWLVEAPTSDSACRLGMGFHAARESAFAAVPRSFGMQNHSGPAENFPFNVKPIENIRKSQFFRTQTRAVFKTPVGWWWNRGYILSNMGIITIRSRDSRLFPMDKAWHFCTLRKAATTRLAHQCHVCIKAGSKCRKERILIYAGWIPILHQTEKKRMCVCVCVCYTGSHHITNYLLGPCAAIPPFCWHECAYTSLVSRLRASLRQTLRSRGEPTTFLAHCKPTDLHILVVVLSLRIQFYGLQ